MLYRTKNYLVRRGIYNDSSQEKICSAVTLIILSFLVHIAVFNTLYGSIMEEIQTIVALGDGTVTKRVYGDGRIERCDNVKDVKLYIEKIDEMIDRKRKFFAE